MNHSISDESGNCLALISVRPLFDPASGATAGMRRSIICSYTDHKGQPLASRVLYWRIELNGATAEEGSSVTDVNGFAKFGLTIPEVREHLRCVLLWPEGELERRLKVDLIEDAISIPCVQVGNGAVLALMGPSVPLYPLEKDSIFYMNFRYTDKYGNPIIGVAIYPLFYGADAKTIDDNSCHFTDENGVVTFEFRWFYSSSYNFFASFVPMGDPKFSKPLIIDFGFINDMPKVDWVTQIWPLPYAADYGLPGSRLHTNTCNEILAFRASAYGKGNSGPVYWRTDQSVGVDFSFEKNMVESVDNGFALNRVRSDISYKVPVLLSADYTNWVGANIQFMSPGSSNSLFISYPNPYDYQRTITEGTGLPEIHVTYLDKMTDGLPSQRIDWTWTSSHNQVVMFPEYSNTNDAGIATTHAIVPGVPPGQTVQVTIVATSHDNPNDNDSRTFSFGLTGLRFLQPDSASFPINKPNLISILYLSKNKNPISGAKIRIAGYPAPNLGAYEIANQMLMTDATGMASTYITAVSPLDVTLTAQGVDNPDDYAVLHLSFTEACHIYELTLNPLHPGGVLSYDTWEPVEAVLSSPSGDKIEGVRLLWGGHVDCKQEFTITDADGKSINYIAVRTMDGYPSSQTVRELAVCAPPNSKSATRNLYFNTPASDNSLSFSAPDKHEKQAFNTPITASVSLVSGLGDKLGNYKVDWSGDDGIVFENSQTMTSEEGITENTFYLVSRDGAAATKTIYATAEHSGQGPANLQLNFDKAANGVISITSPNDRDLQKANVGVLFEARFVDGNDVALTGEAIEWNAITGNATFDPTFSLTDDEGVASSTLRTSGVEPGEKIEVGVKATSRKSNFIFGENNFIFGANSLVITKPDPASGLEVNKYYDLQASYKDANGAPIANASISWWGTPAESGETYQYAYNNSTTSANGVAGNSIWSAVAMDVVITASSGSNPVDTGTANLEFVASVEYTLTIDLPSCDSVLMYDTYYPVNVTLSCKDGSNVAGVTLSWEGAQFEVATTTTDSLGKSSNNVVVETTEGYPANATTKHIVVSAVEVEASNGRDLTFGQPAEKTNILQIIRPDPKVTYPVNNWIEASITLKNALKHGLGSYGISWEGDSGIEFKNSVTTTLPDGSSENMVRLDKQSAESFQKSITVSAERANADRSEKFNFSGSAVYVYRLEANKHYAHNPVDDQVIDPEDASQIITMTMVVESLEGLPEVGVPVTYEFIPSSILLSFYDVNNNVVEPCPIKPNSPRMGVIIPTDNLGVATLKVGSKLPYIGTVAAWPGTSPSHELSFTIASVNEDVGASGYSPPTIPGTSDKVLIPEAGAPYVRSMIPIEELPGSTEWTVIVFWFKGEDGLENIKMSTLDVARSGFLVPYGLLDVSGDDNNEIAYWAADQLGNIGQSQIYVFAAEGDGYGAHPNPSIERTLPQPYLYEHAKAVNENNIRGGLRAYFPLVADGNLKVGIGQKLYANAYLNGYVADGTGQPKSNVVPPISYPHTITQSDLDKGLVELIFDETDLQGYDSYNGIYGTFEADWFIANKVGGAPVAWSMVLGRLPLGTSLPKAISPSR